LRALYTTVYLPQLKKLRYSVKATKQKIMSKKSVRWAKFCGLLRISELQYEVLGPEPHIKQTISVTNLLLIVCYLLQSAHV
jgi:hypothetical protein